MSTELFLKLSEVQSEVPFSRSQIYALIADDKFPKPIKLSQRSSAWLKSEIDEWKAARIAERDEGVAA